MPRSKRSAEKAADGAGPADTAPPPAGGRPKRTKTTGWKELKGAAPYRADFKAGVVAEVTAGPDPARLPVRNTKGELVFPGFPTFRPNLTPEQVIRAGAFGGTYFRTVTSAVTGEKYTDAWKEFDEWFDGVPTSQLASSWDKYSEGTNFFGVSCGGSLDMWESSGWISNIDPYGWFQWYCRFYQGRRSTDDARQVSRWCKLAGPKGRFRNQLIGNCARARTAYDDVTVSPVIRQSLLHWGKMLTESEARAYVKLKQLPPLRPAATKPIDLKTFPQQ